MVYVLQVLRALTCYRALRTLCLAALVIHVSRILRALVIYLPRPLLALMLHVPHTLHTLLVTNMISNLYLRNIITVFFFISDINLQYLLIYVNLTALFHQPVFLRKCAL